MRETFCLGAALLGLLAAGASAQANIPPKRGISYVSQHRDYDALLSPRSPIGWYFNWSPNPSPGENLPGDAQARIEFVPALHHLDHLDNDIKALGKLPDTSKHLFTFNEPDGENNSGGSNLNPVDAAKAYIEKIVPLRNRFQISHPAVTSSPRGLDWLTSFKTACWKIDPVNGCPADFVGAHFYGSFGALTWWMTELSEWYSQSDSGIQGDLKIWLSELGWDKQDAATTMEFMKDSLVHLDGLQFVEKYAWFGAFRPQEASRYTGAGVALLQEDGGLSELGAFYLGGEANGFKPGQKGETSAETEKDEADKSSTACLQPSFFALWLLLVVAIIWTRDGCD